MNNESLTDRPRKHLFLAFAEIGEWNYESAKEHLEVYLKYNSLSQYDRAIGKVNLLASKVTLLPNGGKDLALEKEIESLIHRCEQEQYFTLKTNLEEIRIQLLLKSYSQSRAKETAGLVKSIVDDPRAKDNLFILKWSILAETPTLASTQNEIKTWKTRLLKLKKQALEIKHYETVREVDFYLARFQKNLVEKVFFGTPFKTYRQRIIDEYSPQLPDHYWYSLNQQINYRFDYLSFNDLKPGSLPMRLILALSQDFYRPLNKYSLFTAVFPKEHINPDSSFNKLHQVIFRARKWLDKNDIPLDITEENESFSLMGPVSIKIYLKDRKDNLIVSDDKKIIGEKITDIFHEKMFSINDLIEAKLFKNLRAAQRYLKENSDLIERHGKGKNTRYSIHLQV